MICDWCKNTRSSTERPCPTSRESPSSKLPAQRVSASSKKLWSIVLELSLIHISNTQDTHLKELQSEKTEFKREVGLFGGVSVLGGIMIGSGIFYLGRCV